MPSQAAPVVGECWSQGGARLLVDARRGLPHRRPRPLALPPYDFVLAQPMQDHGALVGDEALHLPLGGVAERLDEGVSGSRSEEHTSELQSRQYLVCRLLLEKKKQH